MPPATLGRALALCSILARSLPFAVGSRHPLLLTPPAFLPLPTAALASGAAANASRSTRPSSAAGWLASLCDGRGSHGRSSSSSRRERRGGSAMGAGGSGRQRSSSRINRGSIGGGPSRLYASAASQSESASASAGGAGAGAAGAGAGAGVPTLDKALFTETRALQAVRVPALRCNEVIQALSPFLFRTNRIRSVVLPAAEGGQEGRILERGQRLVLLQTEAEVVAAERRREEGGGARRTAGTDPLPMLLARVVASIEGASVVEYEVELGYDDLPLDQVLRRLLPPGVEAPSAFETVGHLAHLNLREEVLPYKHLVAQAILDKNPRIRTVVNKIASLDAADNPFRVLPLEVIGGERETNVELRESGAVFRFDFAEVYWNSRLQAEHARVVALITTAAAAAAGVGEGGEKGGGKGAAVAVGSAPRPVVVWDVFAGVGPFAVPLAMRGCRVHANDLNGRSHHYLQANARRNKVDNPHRLRPSNLDGRAFLRGLAKAEEPCDHVLMNLPATAIDFLDVFAGAEGRARFGYLLAQQQQGGGQEGQQQQGGQGQGPMLHVYCFSKAADPERDALDRLARALGLEGRRRLEKAGSPNEAGVRIHHVRDVAPKKPMLCLSFPLGLAWEE